MIRVVMRGFVSSTYAASRVLAPGGATTPGALDDGNGNAAVFVDINSF
jgi:hypothetical protein